MKALLPFLAATLVFVTTAAADWVIETKIESPTMNGIATTKLKGDKMRMDISGGLTGAVSTIIDTTSGDSTTLIHSKKMAMKISGAQLRQTIEAARKMGGVKSGAEAPAFQATGQKEKIGDFDCEIYTVTNGTMTARLWVTEDPKAAPLKIMQKQAHAGMLGGMQRSFDSSTLPGVAVKTESVGRSQKMTTTVLSLKEEDVEAKEFEVPADYQTMTMPSLPQGK